MITTSTVNNFLSRIYVHKNIKYSNKFLSSSYQKIFLVLRLYWTEAKKKSHPQFPLNILTAFSVTYLIEQNVMNKIRENKGKREKPSHQAAINQDYNAYLLYIILYISTTYFILYDIIPLLETTLCTFYVICVSITPYI